MQVTKSQSQSHIICGEICCAARVIILTKESTEIMEIYALPEGHPAPRVAGNHGACRSDRQRKGTENCAIISCSLGKICIMCTDKRVGMYFTPNENLDSCSGWIFLVLIFGTITVLLF